MSSIKSIHKAKITNFFKAKGAKVENINDDYMLIDERYKINKSNLWWTDLETGEKKQGYDSLLRRYDD